jgi:hypothetical protein
MSDTLVTNLDTSELKAIGAVHNEAELKQLLIDAKLADEEDRLLTIRQALKKYKPAVFWAMFLSVSYRERVRAVEMQSSQLTSLLPLADNADYGGKLHPIYRLVAARKLT